MCLCMRTIACPGAESLGVKRDLQVFGKAVLALFEFQRRAEMIDRVNGLYEPWLLIAKGSA